MFGTVLGTNELHLFMTKKLNPPVPKGNAVDHSEVNQISLVCSLLQNFE